MDTEFKKSRVSFVFTYLYIDLFISRTKSHSNIDTTIFHKSISTSLQIFMSRNVSGTYGDNCSTSELFLGHIQFFSVLLLTSCN